MGDKKRKKTGKGSKKYYLIDYENVHKTGFNGLLNLNSEDSVIIFYSGNADKITFNLHQQIIDSKADITYFEVKAGGKNALDFQLSTYLGYLIGNNKKAKYYIVSNDKGFEYVRDFWRKHGTKIDIISNIEQEISVPEKAPPPEEKKKNPDDDIRKVLQDMKLDKESIRFIVDTFNQNINQTNISLPNRKQKINIELCKKFGNDKTKEIYKNLKPFLK